MSMKPESGANSESTIVTKDVVVTAYGAADYMCSREFLWDVFGAYTDRDLTDTRESVEYEFDAEWSFEGRFGTKTRSLRTGLEEEYLYKAYENGELDLGDANVHAKAQKVRKWVENEGHATTGFLEHIFEEIDEIAGYERDPEAWNDVLFKTDDGAFSASVDTDRAKRRRLLRHQAERTPDDRYAQPDDTPTEEMPMSVQFSVHIEAPQGSVVDSLSEELVSRVYREVGRLDGIERVRLSDCETVETKRGECYNL